jgi:hypothetical protein
MIELAGLAISGVAALSTVVQAYYAAKSAKSTVRNSVLRKAEKRAGQPLKTGVKKVAEVIDDKLLATLQHEIEAQNEKLIEAFRSPDISEAERGRCVEAARKQICDFLSAVKRFNDDSLPTKRLEQLWSSNKCKT